MGALAINDFKPCLSEESLLNISESILAALDECNGDFFSDEFRCNNGFLIEVNAENVGFNYRRIRLSYLQVLLWDSENETYLSNEDCEEYQDKLNVLLQDKLYDLNDTAELEFEESRKYCEL